MMFMTYYEYGRSEYSADYPHNHVIWLLLVEGRKRSLEVKCQVQVEINGEILKQGNFVSWLGIYLSPGVEYIVIIY